MDYEKLYGLDADGNKIGAVPKTVKQAEPVTLPVLPDTEEIRDLARLVMPSAFKVLYTMMMSDATPPAIRKSCAETLIDRGYGKAPQAIEHTGKVQFEQLIVECYPPTIEGHAIEVKAPQEAVGSLPLQSK